MCEEEAILEVILSLKCQLSPPIHSWRAVGGSEKRDAQRPQWVGDG